MAQFSMLFTIEPLKILEEKAIKDSKEKVMENKSKRKVLENILQIEEKTIKDLTKFDNIMNYNLKVKELADFVDIFEPTYIVSDVTPEAVARLLYENGGKLGLFSAEGGIFGTILGRYSNGVPNLEVFLKGYSGEDFKVNRIGRDSIQVKKSRLTIGLAIQPTILENLKHKNLLMESGFLPRMLFIKPDFNYGEGKFYTNPISENGKVYYSNLIRDLNNISDCTLTFEQEAEHIFANYFEDFEKLMKNESSDIILWAAKLRGQVARIAGILQLIENQQAGKVNKHIIESAITIGNYLIQHAKSVFNEMEFNKELHLANRILKWIKKHSKTEFTLSEVYNALKTSAANSTEDFRAGLDKLKEHNYLNHYTEKKQGRPAVKYLVNPEFRK